MGSMAPSPPQQLSLADLKALSVLGQGARGVVFHVVATGAGNNPVAMALKAMSRAAARHRGRGPGGAHGGGGADGHRRIWFERDVLLALHHPLLPSLRGVVATDAVVGFAIDRCPGGDLKSLMVRRRRTALPDSVIRFYAAELVLALEHLHGLGVVYRDLKPENVLIQGSGHIMLVDFDLSTTLPPPPPPPPPDAEASSPSLSSRHHLNRKSKNKVAAMILACLSSSRHAVAGASSESSTYQPSPQSTTSRTASSSSSGCGSSGPAAKSKSFVGTEDYVAPEIVAGSGHDHAVDWWGLGVVLYEMLYGRTPFRGRSRRETFRRVLAAPPELPPLLAGDGDGGGRAPLRDLIARLLDKDPATRLGARGVRRHAFFRGVDWDRVLDVARPPFIPAPDDDDGSVGAVALDVEKVVGEVFGGETPSPKAAGSEDVTDDDDFSIFF